MTIIMSVLIPVVILLLMAYDIFKEERSVDISIKEYAIALIGFSSLIFIFMASAGVLNSGYHFVDDHEICRVHSQLDNSGLFATIVNQIKADLAIRFRPTYWLIRILQVWLLGTNFMLWHIMQTVLVILSMFFSYVFVRKMRIPSWMACIFVAVIFIGRQSEVLWRLGPQENLGVLFLMLTLLSLLHYLKNKRTLIISIPLMFLLGGVKEAFLLLLPVLPVWLVIVEYRRMDIEAFSLKVYWQIVKKRWMLFVAAFLIFIVDIGIIYFIVGTNQIGYAGIDQSYGVKDYIFLIARICFQRKYFWFYIKMMLIGLLGLLFPVSVYIAKKKNFIIKTYFADMILSMLTLGYVFFSQFVLHAKSGLNGRYIIPIVIAYAYFWIVDMAYLLKKTAIKECIVCYYVFIACVAMGCMVECERADSAYEYAEDGRNTTALLDKIAEYKAQNPDIAVLMYQDYQELMNSAAIYLQEKYDIKNVYVINHSVNDDGKVYDIYRYSDDEKEYIYGKEAQIYVGYNDISDFMTEYGLILDEYNSYTFGLYTVYIDRSIDYSTPE